MVINKYKKQHYIYVCIIISLDKNEKKLALINKSTKKKIEIKYKKYNYKC